ncbi:periplasmic component of amino acid ABC-type transporter/signal transduction system [Variovorax sp. CF313]|uniref:transporter substrate-binding domain-containing protein n=1 Tax=Variovorax sp. CF313 TaxID=1144315 RepID=UPI000270F30A|nr:transporter substrate-binding domain-containing protein [Variovorax sp. CF313]EJL78413.1 periplasmic component of amino acid ABC-type transporter/signal transduction system [Variovorax sp. CF313]
MKFSRLQIVLGLALSGLMATGAVHAQSALDTILKNKKIAIGVPPDFPPYGSMDRDFKMHGLDIDMANYIGAKLGVEVDLIPVTSANRIPYLQKRKAALVIATLGKNPDREKQIDFAAAYSPFYQAIFGAKTLSIKNFADLSGRSIAVTRGSVEDQELNKVAPAGADIRRFDDNTRTVAAFVSGQAQLIATGASVANTVMSSNPSLGITYKLLLKESPNYIGVAKGEDSLRLRVNGIIDEAKKNGELDKLSMKWLERPAGELPQ